MNVDGKFPVFVLVCTSWSTS